MRKGLHGREVDCRLMATTNRETIAWINRYRQRRRGRLARVRRWWAQLRCDTGEAIREGKWIGL